jgi:hypothetical protein
MTKEDIDLVRLALSVYHTRTVYPGCVEAFERIVQEKEMPTPMTIEMEADERQAALDIVNEQAKDDGLWFVAKYASEAYLQQELRRLHRSIELAALQSPRVPDNYIAVPLEPTGPMIMYGIHAHEKNDDLPNIGLGPKCVGIYKAMIKGVRHE